MPKRQKQNTPAAPETYRTFMNELEELERASELFGGASFEASDARARVKRAREAAIVAWRQQQTAA